MAGWGPVCPGYHIVAATEHIPSLADGYATAPEIADEILEFRRNAENLYGYSILTEHGRIPVCIDGDDGHDAHCYHAHALIFPLKITPIVDARSYFSRSYTFRNLSEVLSSAQNEEAYFIYSDRIDNYNLFADPLNLPRQFARMLVAHSIGRDDLADWRERPRIGEAEGYAADLRESWERRRAGN